MHLRVEYVERLTWSCSDDWKVSFEGGQCYKDASVGNL